MINQPYPIPNQMANYYQPIYPNSYENRYVTQPSQYNNNVISGGVVDNFEHITANDVPMNSPQSVFIKTDLSEIQVRRWNSNGQIEIKSFTCADEIVEKKITLNDVMDRLDKMEKLFSTKKAPTKKEVDSE